MLKSSLKGLIPCALLAGMSSAMLSAQTAPQGSFPGVCKLFESIRSEWSHLREIHDANKAYFDKDSALWGYLKDFPHELKRGVGRHTFANLRERKAVTTMLGSETYMGKARYCRDMIKPFLPLDLTEMDQGLSKALVFSSPYYHQDVYNIRETIERNEALLVDLRKIQGRTQRQLDILFPPSGPSRSLFEPCATFEAASDIYFRKIVPDLVKKFNRYDNPESFRPFWGGLEAHHDPYRDEISALRYKVWLAMGAAWTIEKVTTLLSDHLRLMERGLTKLSWEISLFKTKSRYEAFYCRMPR